jgi:uncharacterized membrane protein YhaH (DUF805 family)
MNFPDAVSFSLRNWNNFNGRTCRSEFWFFVLFSGLVLLCLATLDSVSAGHFVKKGPLFMLGKAVFLIPNLSSAIRRCHDIDQSGWWFMIYCIPGIGLLFAGRFLGGSGSFGPNQYGPDPLEGEAGHELS